MGRKTLIRNEKPIAIYNCNEKECIGIFKQPSLVARYLFTAGRKEVIVAKVTYALRRKTRISDVLSFPVAIRYCNELQLKQLGNKEYIILSKYKEPSTQKMKGFTSTRKTFAIVSKERHESVKRKVANT